MTARWEEALDVQLDLYRFWNSPMGHAYGKGWARSFWQSAMERAGEDAPRINRGENLLNDDLGDTLATMTWVAEPIWVDPDMMRVYEAAVPGFKPEPLEATDLVTTQGFLYLPGPMYIHDIAGKRVSYRAFSWCPASFASKGKTLQGIVLALYSYIHDEDDYKMGTPQGTRFLLAHVTPWIFGLGYPKKPGSGAPGLSEALDRVQADLSDVDETATLADVDEQGLRMAGTPDGFTQPPALQGYTDEDATLAGIARQVQCLWRLMAQHLAVKGEAHPSKPVRKRAARLSFPDKRITVITLRRPKAEPDEDAAHRHVDWTHRWLVGGHWRNQWFSSLGIHRQIWIAPFIKGPQDKPLEIRTLRAWEFVQ